MNERPSSKRHALVYCVLFSCQTAADISPPATPPVKPAPEARVGTVAGQVERHGDSTGWVQVKSGDRLLADEAIRTGENSRVELRVGDESQLTIEPNSEIAVVEVSEAAERFKLRGGRVSVSHDAEAGRILRLENAAGQVLETRAATFSALASANGFTVATTVGSVRLESAGKAVLVTAGQQASALAGAVPSAAAPVPQDLLLKVARAATPKELCAVVEGTASPGAEVRVAGELVSVDAQGHFRVEVPRASDREAVVVAIADVRGRTQERTVTCQPAVKPSTIKDFSIQWGQ